jgi:hypothetical protein
VKARSRMVEREIAKILTNKFTPFGYQIVERIPTTGRVGPDITINEVGLVVDVKSRLEVPKTIIRNAPFIFDGYYAIPIEQFPSQLEPEISKFTSTILSKWYDHMDEWTMRYRPGEITAIVVHRPKMPYGKSMLIIKNTNKEKLVWKMQ